MKETTGQRIKRLRKVKHINVTDFANMIGVSRMHVYRYESDQIEKMPYQVLIPIAKALDTTPMYLLGYDEEETKEESKINKDTKKWLDAVGELNFSDDEFNQLVNYAKFIISQRKK